MKKLKISLLFFFLLTAHLSADMPEGIVEAIKEQDEVKLAGYFNTNIEMTVLANEDVYSKAQAREIVKRFFTNHPVDQFQLIHEGGKANSQFAIGEMKSGDDRFRITIFVKSVDQKLLIHQLRIEHDN